MFDKKEWSKQYYQENKERILTNHIQWRGNNPEYYKNWRKENKEHIRKYLENNHEKILKQDNQWRKNKRRTDLKFNINSKMAIAIWASLKGNKNGRRWEDLVPYNFNQLKNHLGKTLPKNYTWQDYLDGELEIDHIHPISIFSFNKPTDYDFKRCWSLENLRLLTKKENGEKSNKLTRPFQPALKIF